MTSTDIPALLRRGAVAVAAGREKKPLDTIPAVVTAIRAAEEELKDTGRVVIRYSGTEALARVMIEAESEEAMRRHAEAIAAAIRAELGA